MRFCYNFVSPSSDSCDLLKNLKMSAVKVKDTVICVALTDSSVKKAVKSYTMSKRYVNTMLKASVINILYHRVNINKNQFIAKKFRDVSYRSFKPKSTDPFIRDFHTYMLACKDAIDKSYLRDFYLFIVDTNSGDIVENYKFSFKYGEDSETNKSQREDGLIESTCELLQTLEELGKHKKFDFEIEIRVEFTYRDDTPDDYEPPGFRNIDESESLMKKMDKGGNSVILGSVFTGFHMMKCRAKGDIFNFNITSSPTNEDCDDRDPSVEEIELEAEETTRDEAVNNIGDIFTEDYDEEPSAFQSSQRANESNKTMNDTYFSQCIDLSSDEGDPIDCPCNLPKIDSFEVDDITCCMCKRRYHTPCQGYLDNSYIRGDFRCSYCRGDHVQYTAKQMASLSRIRYIAGILCKHKSVPQSFASSFAETLSKLKKFEIFNFEGNFIKEVNPQLLADLFKSDYPSKQPEIENFKNIII